MNLLDIVQRSSSPIPWSEGDNIPWNDPGFSARMLKEHLSQEHNLASRRANIIAQHVAWIHAELLGGKPSRLLDLGCGPGLYSSRLAQLGHTCLGIDFSPASIEYAREQACQQGLSSCVYRHDDIRSADYGEGHDLVVLIFGEFNVFCPADARSILLKAHRALKPGGLLLLEPHTFAAVRAVSTQPASWYSAESGLFSTQAHVVMTEAFWDEASAAATVRHFILAAASGAVTRFAQSLQAYTDEQYRETLLQCGFTDVCFYPSLAPGLLEAQVVKEFGLIGITARRN